MDRQSLASSRIASAGYDARTRTLELEFTKGGGVYQYPGVEPHVYDQLVNSYSPGAVFNTHILPRGNHQRMNPDG